MFEEAQINQQSDSKVTLPWAIAVILLTFPLLLVFMHFGQAGRGRAAWFSAAALILATRMRWELHAKRWFWLAIIAVLLIHLPLIFLLRWNSAWAPSFLIFPLFLADFFLDLILIHRVEKYMKTKGSHHQRV